MGLHPGPAADSSPQPRPLCSWLLGSWATIGAALRAHVLFPHEQEADGISASQLQMRELRPRVERQLSRSDTAWKRGVPVCSHSQPPFSSLRGSLATGEPPFFSMTCPDSQALLGPHHTSPLPLPRGQSGSFLTCLLQLLPSRREFRR